MGHNQIVIKPIGAMDLDSSDESVEKHDYRYSLNIETGYAYAGAEEAGTPLFGMIPVGFTFDPQLQYQTLGSYEDRDNNTIIYFVWASNGNHYILRWFRDMVDANNPYGQIQAVIQYPFGWTKDTFITAVSFVDEKLLYWNDNVKPRKINVIKANNTDKIKTWDVFAYKSYISPSGATILVTVFDLSGNILIGTNINLNTGLNAQQAYSELATGINLSPLSQYITANACSDHLHISENIVNSYNVVVTSPFWNTIPANFYGFNLEERFFDRGKWQVDRQPLVSYQQDPSTNVNKVQKIPFQFNSEVFYDDFEPSQLGQVSMIPVVNIDSGLYNANLYNYIQVIINDASLLDPNTWILAKRLKVLVRDHNDGIFGEVVFNNIYNFYDLVDGVPQLVYKFYNTESRIPVAASLTATQYDLVPIKEGAEMYVKDRMASGDITAGYDPVECPNMSLDVAIEDNPQQPLRTIRGRICINTPYMQNTPGRFGGFRGGNIHTYFENHTAGACIGPLYMQPYRANCNGLIMHNSAQTTPASTVQDPSPAPVPALTPFTWYGGGGFVPRYSSPSNPMFNIQDKAPIEYDQRLPEGGWAVYAAGTPYFCLSKQDYVGLETTNDGSLEVSQQYNLNAIGGHFNVNGNNIGSTFELKLPPGIYIIRLPSHWCSFGDKLSKGSAYDLNGTTWQKTSTPIWGCFDGVDIQNSNWLPGQQEFIVDCRNGDVECGTFVVADMSPPPNWDFRQDSRAFTTWTNFSGYLYDDNGRIDVRSETWSGVPVELAGVQNWVQGTQYNVIGQITASAGIGGQAFTDHNGFFYILGDYKTGQNFGTNEVVYDFTSFEARQVNNVQLKALDSVTYSGTLSDLLNKTFNVQSPTADPNRLYSLIMVTDNPLSRDTCMTFVDGVIEDQDNAPVGGINLVVTNGSTGYTNINGEYKLRVWGDIKRLIVGGVFPQVLNPSVYHFFNVTQFLFRVKISVIFSSQFDMYTNPFGTFQGRTIAGLVMSNISEYNITGLPALTPHTLSNIAANAVVQTNTAPYSPTSIWDNGTTAVTRNEYWIDSGLVRGGFYKFAIRYQDELGRQCTCITQPSIQTYIPFDTEDLHEYYPDQYPVGTYLQGKPALVLNILHKPPIWADVMTILMAPENKMATYLEWIANDIVYVQRVVKNALTVDQVTSYENNDATHIRFSIANEAFYQAEYGNSQVAYTWNQGDRLRLKWDNDLNYYQGLFDYEIVVAADNSATLYIPYTQEVPHLFSGTGIRIYTPKTTTEQDVYYEIGLSVKCTHPNFPDNDHAVNSIALTNADCYYRNRTIPVYDTFFVYVQNYPAVIQSQSISDFYSSKDSDIGRIGTVDPYFRQTRYPTKIRTSETYIFNSQTNGLSTYLPFNDVDNIDPVYGPIVRMVLHELSVLVICENKVIAYYIGAITTRDQAGGTILAVANQLFGNERPLEVNFGCQNPESVAVYADMGFIYGWDAMRGLSWRYATNGIFKISDYHARAFFDQYIQQPVFSSPAGFDAIKKKYILTIYPKKVTTATYVTQFGQGGYVLNLPVTADSLGIANGDTIIVEAIDSVTRERIRFSGAAIVQSNINPTRVSINFTPYHHQIRDIRVFYKGAGTTISFRESSVEDRKGWDTFYSFTPDVYGTLNNQLVSFKNGILHLHDLDQVNLNTFYGVKYPSEIQLVTAEMVTEIKNWWAILLDQIQDNQGNDWFVSNVTNPKGQQSSIPNERFIRNFHFWQAAFLRDTTTINVNMPLLNGTILQSNTLTFTLENPANVFFQLKEVRVNFQGTKTTTK